MISELVVSLLQHTTSKLYAGFFSHLLCGHSQHTFRLPEEPLMLSSAAVLGFKSFGNDTAFPQTLAILKSYFCNQWWFEIPNSRGRSFTSSLVTILIWWRTWCTRGLIVTNILLNKDWIRLEKKKVQTVRHRRNLKTRTNDFSQLNCFVFLDRQTTSWNCWLAMYTHTYF